MWQHQRPPKIISFDSLDIKSESLVAVTSGVGGGVNLERRESLFPMQMLPSNYINDVVRCVPRAVCLAGSLKDQRDALNNIIAREGRRPIAGVALKRLTPNHVLRGGVGRTETLLFYFVILGERREIPSQEGEQNGPLAFSGH